MLQMLHVAPMLFFCEIKSQLLFLSDSAMISQQISSSKYLKDRIFFASPVLQGGVGPYMLLKFFLWTLPLFKCQWVWLSLPLIISCIQQSATYFWFQWRRRFTSLFCKCKLATEQHRVETRVSAAAIPGSLVFPLLRATSVAKKLCGRNPRNLPKIFFFFFSSE